MSKKDLSERDICTKFITPAVAGAGWDVQSQIREEVYFTRGRIIVRGKLVTRGKARFADYILYYKPNIPIALIEAKDNHHSVNAKNLSAIFVPFPPHAEQHRIVAKVKELLALCDRLEAQLIATARMERQFLEATLAQAIV